MSIKFTPKTPEESTWVTLEDMPYNKWYRSRHTSLGEPAYFLKTSDNIMIRLQTSGITALEFNEYNWNYGWHVEPVPPGIITLEIEVK